MAPKPRSSEQWTQQFLSKTALTWVRSFLLALTLLTIPLLFLYHWRMVSIYGTSAAAFPTTTNSTKSTTTSSPAASLWVSFIVVDYVYLALIAITLLLHLLPGRPFLRESHVANICILIILAFAWLMLSVLYFADVTTLSYDPQLVPIASSSSSSAIAPSPTNVSTTTLFTVAPATAGHTLPTSDAVIQSPFLAAATPALAIPTVVINSFSSRARFVPVKRKANATSTSPTTTITPPPQPAARVASDASWGRQCHTADGFNTTPCQLMIAFHVIGFLIATVLCIESRLIWWVHMRV